jgi:predicted N-acyltransferase
MPNASSIIPEPGTTGAIPEADWNARNRGANPFSDHRFLLALEQAGCVGAERGWSGGALSAGHQAFAPAWIKTHSHGEFVFDQVWAHAAHRAGLAWYPKLLVAIPLTPVTGPRLLADSVEDKAALIRQLEERVERDALSSCGVNFCDEQDAEALTGAGWLARSDWQFHWLNRGWADFDAFLADLAAKPRKNIRRERRLAHADGWRYRFVDGRTIRPEEIALVDRCYRTTFMLYGNLPLLNTEFFQQCAQRFGEQFLVCIASRNGEDLACSVFWKNERRLYGRYWGALIETRDVHFEACYYQGIEYCIEHGLEAFEPGAQGEHKIRRGFVPVATRSFHYIRHPALREGIRRWLGAEAEALQHYRRELESLIPYRHEADC